MYATETTSSETTWASEDERLRSFGQAIDGIRRRTSAKVGQEDLRYIRTVDRLSRVAEFAGRTLIAVSPGPMLFTIGVVSLWAYKQLQATEIGHAALHGAYNRIDGADKYHSRQHRWQIPIDEASWIRGHNGRHHGLTNVAGHDADINFGPVRLTEQTPHRFVHYFQLPITLLFVFPSFAAAMNLHFTGVSDVLAGDKNGREFDFIEDRSPASVRDAFGRALRKFVPYYAKEYLLWPTLASLAFGWWLGVLVFAKSVLGNLLSELLRNVYSAATIHCGHVGEQTRSYPAGTVPRCKGERYAMQVEATNNFEVPWLVSVFCGALERQIEHHLFPTLPTNRLREISPEVRAVCEAHGVEYRTNTWGRTLIQALAQIGRLSRPLPHERGQASSFAQASS
ncbi:putative LINOLEOYL-CoA DESATURASE (DELTA(6)-DESATURASE) [Enhygromyxa salina]|uniref:Putative LINOLEOYL-CoA DESATURASE (DELTA(6)-DESATURASE) n=1 Tax=Enhygromyxa salina TaxID=215803 RepID=A0A0C2D0R7_9BACT|nr:fatty acid desaturase [Enhygromyxa salina]KIG13717.1 putative LINOLEOYL-CoA DESATURASE (DELTA(6)-DESATURASE) [Enhygromyxa salina]